MGDSKAPETHGWKGRVEILKLVSKYEEGSSYRKRSSVMSTKVDSLMGKDGASR